MARVGPKPGGVWKREGDIKAKLLIIDIDRRFSAPALTLMRVRWDSNSAGSSLRTNMVSFSSRST